MRRTLLIALAAILFSSFTTYWYFLHTASDATLSRTSTTSSQANYSSDSNQRGAATSSRMYRALPNVVVVTSPTPGAEVSDPLVVTGRARGYWFLEATFPILLIDDSGYTVAEGVAHATSDWHTTDMVPFEAKVDINSKAHVKSGIIKLEKDNPSGSNADYVEIPITFKKVTYQ